MAGLVRLAIVGIISTTAASSASAFGGRFFGWSYGPPTVRYYYAMPAPWVAPYDYCVPAPGPKVMAIPDARPTPAPPSQTAEPALQKTAADRSGPPF